LESHHFQNSDFNNFPDILSDSADAPGNPPGGFRVRRQGPRQLPYPWLVRYGSSGRNMVRGPGSENEGLTRLRETTARLPG
jgi:hypothetical protein